MGGLFSRFLVRPWLLLLLLTEVLSLSVSELLRSLLVVAVASSELSELESDSSSLASVVVSAVSGVSRTLAAQAW